MLISLVGDPSPYPVDGRGDGATIRRDLVYQALINRARSGARLSVAMPRGLGAARQVGFRWLGKSAGRGSTK
jgi:hypothetical protein